MSKEPRETDGQYEGTGFFDDLTWLPSRLLFRDRAERAIAWADRHGARMAVLFLEVHDFEGMRQRIGSDAADEVLRDLGNRLVTSLRGEDSVSRTRTAEYAVLLPEVDSPGGAALVGEKLVGVFERPFDPAGAEEVGATVGAAIYPDHALTIVGLLTAADNALKHAKENRPGEVVVYTEDMARQPEGGPPAT
jgi:diguanylate cyclase (GGDEF)-like protein